MQDDRAGLGSGSGFARDKHCPANRKMANKARELGQVPPSTPEAESGTKIHAVLAGQSVELTDEEAETAQYLAERASEIVGEFVNGRKYEEGFERRLWIYRGLVPIRTSKPDLVVTVHEPDGAEILIIDYKTGRTEIDPEIEDTFAQLDEYALTVFLNAASIVKRIKAVLLPRWQGPVWKEYTEDELVKIDKELVRALDAGKADNPEAKPGWYCRYCPGRLVCPSARSEIDVVEPHGTIVALPKGPEAEPFIDKVKRVKALCEQILRQYHIWITESPGCCGAWQIGEGDKTREIESMEDAYGLLVPTHITHEEFLECCTAFIGKLEKKYCNKAGKIAAKAKREFNALLAPIIKEGRKNGSLEKGKQLSL
jgi:CRISPR/Cas system-associated exonuclease Cas4 (RecB family)